MSVTLKPVKVGRPKYLFSGVKYSHKLFLFKILEILPNTIGDFLYHKIQEKSGGFSNSALLQKINKQIDFFHRMAKIINSLNINLNDKTFLELGSGWLPVLPFCCISQFASPCVLTYDLNHHYNQKLILKFLHFIKEGKVPIKLPCYRNASNSPILPRQIKYFSNTNIIHNPPPPGCIDIAFSRFVLEHVTPEDINKIHYQSKSWICDDGYWFHAISPNDHRSYFDKSIGLYDFLQYSNNKWNKMCTRFDYHNRLRLPQYMEVFEKTGWKVIYKSYDVSEKDISNISNLNINPDYKNYTKEELVAGSIIIVLRNN